MRCGDVMGDAIPLHGNPQDYPSVSGSNKILTQKSGTEVDGNTQSVENIFSVPPVEADVEHNVERYFRRQFEANIEPSYDHIGDRENVVKEPIQRQNDSYCRKVYCTSRIRTR